MIQHDDHQEQTELPCNHAGKDKLNKTSVKLALAEWYSVTATVEGKALTAALERGNSGILILASNPQRWRPHHGHGPSKSLENGSTKRGKP